MTRPIAAITTVRYDATYQCAGLTKSNARSGWVPNAPPMISIVTIGKGTTNVSTSGPRTMSLSSAWTSRPTALFIAVLLLARGALPMGQLSPAVLARGGGAAGPPDQG